jgi:two-component system, NarL family, invasion response regulator UvrY
MIQTLIVDDHAVVRNGIVHIIANTKDIVCTGEASNGAIALELIQNHHYDVVVLDIRLGDASGLDILKQLKIFKPQLPVLMLSIYSEKQYAMRALKNGAQGYLTKDSIPEELIEAIRQVACGKTYITPACDEILAGRLVQNKEPHDTLSNREYQIMCSLASGQTVTRIAKNLNLSVKTISTHRTRLL